MAVKEKGSEVMREILFRGKSVLNEEWFYGDLLTHEFSAKDLPDIRDYTNRQQSPVYPDTVGQYTGLTDKNGKKIFEGDIVKTSFSGRECYGVVGYGRFNCSCCDGVYGWTFGDGDIRDYDYYIVIGNIHDNPELLDKERK